MELDPERIWNALRTNDPRFDGAVFCGITSTRIYCRPSCPARTPKRENVRIFPTAAAAQAGGFRACKRCRPDATPGSPEWDGRADLVGRAMRLIADGAVDREGVPGLARRLGYSERHVHRQLRAVVGAGPLELARAQRAQTARLLVESTDVPLTEVAFAAGFSSVRQFNATVREVYATTPSALRARRSRAVGAGAGAARRHGPVDGAVAPAREPLRTIALRLPYRAPWDATAMIGYLAARAVMGIEAVDGGEYRRSLRLPHGAGVVTLWPADGHVAAELRLADLRDLPAAVQRVRALLDLDADPQAIVDALGGDPVIGPLVRAAPGLRVPGHVDAHEQAIRAVLGQQVSIRGAATLAARLTVAYGEPLVEPVGDGRVTHLFPSAAALAEADPATLGMPRSRAAAVVGLASALASGELRLDIGVERLDTRARLLALPGIGPWTAGYVQLRALRDPDVFLASDLVVRRALERLGRDARPAAAERLAGRWRPYRSYATQHLWASMAPPDVRTGSREPRRTAA
ncbi:MAG: DNA-3-methyladenine glycosylase 2 family protein [Patulibacter sp.]|nr:DNA-3-methyladenine glycosylase 2 family protein [Patulibacter sp.]